MDLLSKTFTNNHIVSVCMIINIKFLKRNTKYKYHLVLTYSKYSPHCPLY